MVKIAPSLLSADFLHLQDSVEAVCKSADLLHLDIMDGIFVPNISYGFPVVEAITKLDTPPLDAHLMIAHPDKYVERFAKLGVKMLSFHYEAVPDPSKVAEQIRDCGMSPGLAFNPDVPVDDIFPWLGDFDYILVMSVFAGFGGQAFIESSYDRIHLVKNEIARQNLSCRIEVDGGVTLGNCRRLAEAGADMLVAGNTVFKADDPAAMVASLRDTANGL